MAVDILPFLATKRMKSHYIVTAPCFSKNRPNILSSEQPNLNGK